MTLGSLPILSQFAAGLVVLFLPGYAWLTWLAPRPRDWPRRLADAAALSLALNVLVVYLAFLAGRRFSPGLFVAYYVIVGGLGAAALALALRHAIFVIRLRIRQARTGPTGLEEEAGAPEAAEAAPATPGAWAAALVIGLIAALVLWRFYQVRDLALPAWVDSLHHVLIVRLFLEGGGVPDTFSPYMPVPFYYHFGFHQSAALFSFWSGLAADRAVLVLGQVLNALVALLAYRFGVALWSDWRRAVVAALLIGFVSQMPAYYVTWGRYTLLTGVILLLGAMSTGLDIVRSGGRRERVARLAILSAGLLLTHYFAGLLLALFLGVLFVYLPLAAPEAQAGVRRMRSAGALFYAGIAGLFLALPWLVRVWENAQAFSGLTTVLPSQSLDEVYFSNYLSYLSFLLGPQRNYLLLALAGLGLAWVGWRRSRWPLTLWTLGLLALGSPWGPKLEPFRPDHALIVFFIPAGLLVADGLFTVVDRLRETSLGSLARLLALALLAALTFWGMQDTADVLNPVTVLADEADLEALAWVEAETPPEAAFLINVAVWQNGVYRGVDGGWWILPLTGHRNLLPPTMYILGPPAYVQETNELAAQASRLQGCSPEFWDLIERAELGYVYLKEGAGSLTAASLAGCDGLETVYRQGGVTILQVR